MIHVRRYTPADEGPVLDMARAFHAESPLHSPFPFDAGKVRALLIDARASPDWLAIVAMTDENVLAGFALVTVFEMYFSRARQLGDLALYVAPHLRGARAFPLLVNAIEGWAGLLGIDMIEFGINTGIRHDQALRSFVKLGYLPTGLAVRKVAVPKVA